MLGKTLGELVEDLQHECEFSVTPGVGQQLRPRLKYALRAAQEDIFDEFDWPHMRSSDDDAWFDVETQAGQRYYDYPDTLDVNSIVKVYTRIGSSWVPLKKGIVPEDYTAFDSDADVRADPIQKWRQRSAEQFEVWPLPASNDLPIRFVGRRQLGQLLNDDDTADLDSRVIVLWAASRVLFKRDEKLAAKKLAEANRRYQVIANRAMKGTNFTFACDDGNYDGYVDPDKRIISATREV